MKIFYSDDEIFLFLMNVVVFQLQLTFIVTSHEMKVDPNLGEESNEQSAGR